MALQRWTAGVVLSKDVRGFHSGVADRLRERRMELEDDLLHEVLEVLAVRASYEQRPLVRVKFVRFAA